MKRLVWIYSVNSGGAILINSGSGMIWNRSRKVQDRLREMLSDEWAVSIISFDITKDAIPDADVIVYSQMDIAYLPEEIKRQGIEIPFTVLQTGDWSFLKQQLEQLEK